MHGTGNVVLALYRPRAGNADALKAIVARHVPTLREIGLATDRPVLLLEASDGTLVEIFEWVPGGAAKAHDHPRVAEMWEAMAAVADFPALGDLPEAKTPFAHFRPVDGVTI